MDCAMDCSTYDLAMCDAPAGWGNCINFGDADTCLPDEVCITDGGMPPSGICTGQSCATPADCPAAPPTGDATPACMDLTADMINDCYLSCEMGQMCPDGMTCFGGFLCIWPPL